MFPTHFDVKLAIEHKRKISPFLLEKCIQNHIGTKPRTKDATTFIIEISSHKESVTTPQQIAPLLSSASIVTKIIKAETKIASSTGMNWRFSPSNPNPECRSLRPNLFWIEKNGILGQ